MPGYRTPLPRALASALEAAINRALSMDENSPLRLARLKDKLVRLELEGLGIVLSLRFTPYRVTVEPDDGAQADTVITGSPLALLTMAIPDDEGRWGTAGSGVQISGDAGLARDLERLFSRLDPDWEGQAAIWFGDTLGHQLSAGARGAFGEFRQTMRTLEGIAGEYLNRTTSPVARADDIEVFGQAIDSLRDATERLEARLRILRTRRSETQGPAGNEA